MGKCSQIVLVVIPWICAVCLAVTTVCTIISLNQDVKWNEYSDVPLPVDGLFTFYYHTLWSSSDAATYDVYKGKYITMLKEHDNESWKVPVRTYIYIGIALACMSLITLFISMAVQAARTQKIHSVIFLVTSCLAEFTAGWLILMAATRFKNNIDLGISENAAKYYHKEKGEMKLGYYVAVFSALIMIIISGLKFLHTYLYIRYGEGKWYCKKGGQTEVKPF